MATVVSITKKTPFQGRDEEFSNRYVYSGVNGDEDVFLGLIDAIVAAEKTIFATAVTFVRGQAWDSGIPPNYMRASKLLSGTGAKATSADFYRECAVLVKWPLPRAFGLRRSTHRSLKKWLHLCSAEFASGFGGGVTPYNALSSYPALQAYTQSVTSPLAGSQLIAESGAEPNGPPQLHPYLEHRQFPRGRKERT